MAATQGQGRRTQGRRTLPTRACLHEHARGEWEVWEVAGGRGPLQRLLLPPHADPLRRLVLPAASARRPAAPAAPDLSPECSHLSVRIAACMQGIRLKRHCDRSSVC